MAAERLVLPHCVVLKQRASGEKFTLVSCLSPQKGVFTALLRNSSSRSKNKLQLDLFDEGEAQIDSKPSDGLHLGFLVDFSVEERHSGIGSRYAALVAASWLSGLILANPMHEETLPQVHLLLRRSLDSLAGAAPPTATLCKTLYLYAKEEGYPISEEWPLTQALPLRDATRALLKTPLADITLSDDTQSEIFDSLSHYVEYNTDIHLPKSPTP